MKAFLDYFLFQIFPYLSLAVCILGTALRFDRDPYSWRSKSSQMLKRRQLIAGSILFHVGVLTVLGGHFVGLLTPVVVFETLGISHETKQIMAMSVGGIAGILCMMGLLTLLHRRLFEPRIRATSSFADIAVLVLLLVQLTLGLFTITVSAQHMDGSEMVKFMEWAQHIVTFRPGAYSYIIDVALVFKIHITLGLFILMIVPFTRLVHVMSAPIGYVFRPYQIVRRRAIR